jgi:G3E family GTPase
MTRSNGGDAALLPGSIVAGPSALALLRDLGQTQTGVRTGLLTKAAPAPAIDGLITFLLSGSDPERIVGDIRRIAAERKADHLVILCEPDRPPMAYASLFVAGEHVPQTLTDVARLTATSFAIESGSLVNVMLGREVGSLSASFLAEQLEFVTNIVLDGDLHFELARHIAEALNPRARISSIENNGSLVLGAGTPASFDFDAALSGARWRQLLDGPESSIAIGDSIVAFPYRARRPFHPERFWRLVQHNWRSVFRAKGFFWLGSRMDEVGGLNLAGSEVHCASAGTWWAARDQQSREAEMSPRTRAEWQEPFGDRRQSFAVMALDLDEGLLRSQIDACLLTDEEMAAGPASWHNLPDPLPSWSTHAHHHHHHQECDHEHDHEHECDHDHGSGEHDCCHH